QLGQLYFDWRHPDRADEQYQAALRLARKRQAEAEQADLYNDMGRVLLVRLQEEADAGRRPAGRGKLAQVAADYFDRSVSSSAARGRTIEEGWARKNRAQLMLMEGRVAQAEEDSRKTEQIFR